MSNSLPLQRPLIACDIGNSRLKFGSFDLGAARSGERTDQLLRCHSRHTLQCSGTPDCFASLDDWITRERLESAPIFVASVQQQSRDALAHWYRKRLDSSIYPNHHGDHQLRFMTFADFDLVLQVDYPERLGIDRLAAAWGARRIAGRGVPAIVIDHGSAITVDLVSSQGSFMGGSILPGSGLMAKSLYEGTDALPNIDMQEFTLDRHAPSEPDGLPTPVGRDTESAIRAGVTWGVVGALRELVGGLSRKVTNPPALFVAGSASDVLAQWLAGSDVRSCTSIEELVLLSIATRAAESLIDA